MRGSIRSRSKGSWTLMLDLGRTPEGKRQQKTFTVKGKRKDAEQKLADLIRDLGKGEYVERSDLTLAPWLTEWFTATKGAWSANTASRYSDIIENNLTPSTLGSMKLQAIRATHIEAYYASKPLAASTLGLHHTILNQALRKAARQKMILSNPMVDLDRRPKKAQGKASEDARQHCWTVAEARAFLAVTKVAGPQPAAFYALALDSGARKGELCGLRWPNLDLETGKARIVEQLLVPGAEPVFGPPKTRRPRTVALSAETVELLRVHRKEQRELMMANRTTYRDLGLVFAKQYSDLRQGEMLGYPLQINNLGQREYAKLIKQAEVKRIKFHGLRHTCATLLLQARVPVHVVSERLGHSKVSMTMEVYAHVLPDMQTDAAATIGSVLHG